MEPLTEYAKQYVPEYYSELNNYEKIYFIRLFDSPFNHFIEIVKKNKNDFKEEYLYKFCINLSEQQTDYLDHLNLKYMYGLFNYKKQKIY